MGLRICPVAAGRISHVGGRISHVDGDQSRSSWRMSWRAASVIVPVIDG